MATDSTLFAEAQLSAEIQPETRALSLADVAVGVTGMVIALDLEPQLAAWLRAVGVGEGDRIDVLRAGALGGPLHVRNASGGEFALNRQLARSIRVKIER